VLSLDEQDFEELVEQALESLPEWIKAHLENVAVMTAAWPSQDQRRASGVRAEDLLLGLYEGVPLTRRGRGYHLMPPDRITLFQGPLEMVARSSADLIRLVQRTVAHEVAHHFGMSDERLRELDL
jgi:predicted Zn-dependent protease with MMP-like domain